MKEIRVLFAAHSGEMSGGANPALLALMTGLMEQNIRPTVLAPAEGAFCEKCRELGIAVLIERYRGCSTVFRHTPKDVLRLLKLVASPALSLVRGRAFARAHRGEFDLVYTNDRMIMMGGCVARGLKTPHIWHSRCFGRENGNCFPAGWYAIMDRLSDAIVVISRDMQREFERKIAPEKIVLIYDGINTGRYACGEREEHGTFELLLAGRLVPEKGQMDALHAMKRLADRGVTSIRLNIAGSTPSYAAGDYERALHAFVHENHLEESVRFLGQIDDMPALMKRIDAALVTSRREAFGLITAESMAAGLPVVGADTGCTPELVTDGETGFLYKMGDPEALAAAIEWLAEHPSAARCMGRCAAESAEKSFSIERTVAQVSRLIRKTVEN